MKREAVLLLVIAACSKQAPGVREHERSADSASSAPPVGVPPPREERCAVLFQRFQVSECNPKPARRNEPECWSYTIEPTEDQRDACLPASVRLVHTGWHTVGAEEAVANVVYDAAPPRTASLRLDHTLQRSVLEVRGVELANLVFDDHHVTEWQFGFALRSHIGTKSLPVKDAP